MEKSEIVTVERIIPAPPEVVFQAWLDPGALARFMRPTEGTTIGKVETDPRVGGRFLIVMIVGGQELPHQGVYQVIEPHRRLVFTWQSRMATGPNSEVTIALEPTSKGGTHLTLRHSGLGTESARTAHRGGWTGILDTLAAADSYDGVTPASSV